MNRRIAPNLLLLSSAFIASAPVRIDAISPNDYHLRVRHEIEHELDYLSNGEFAPLPPNSHNRAMLEQQPQQQQERGTRKCTSPLVAWTTTKVREMGYHKYKELFDNKIIQMAYVYKHYIDKNEYEEFFVNESQTEELKRRHGETIAFWTEADIDNSIMTDEILLLSMHGSVLEDTDKLVPIIMRIFDFTAMSDVLAFATKVQEIVQDLPGGYHNALLTMNAVATRSTHNRGTYNGHDDSSRRIKDSIIIGDGVLQFLYDSGLETSGPDFVYAHEFGHHLQFQLDMAIPPGSTYEHDDRRKELMADAISGYFLAHDKGGDMMADEIGIFDETAFATGDCSVTESDHHGTPKQRQCAAIWGASLAAPDHVPILDPEMIVRSFNEAYGRILELDERECTLVLEESTSTSLDYYDPEEEKKDPVLQGVEVVSVWNDADYQEEGKPNINLGDWLESQEGRDPNHDLEWEDEWEDPFETQDNNDRPSSHSNNVPDDEVVSSLMPIGEENSWESRGKPSSYAPNEGIGTMPNNNGKQEVVTQGKINPYGNFADVGKPEETRKSYRNHELSVHDCHMPWVYCESSSSHMVHVSGTLYMISALAAASSLVIMWY